MTPILGRRAALAGSAALAAAPAPAQQVTLDFPSWQADEPGFAEWWKELIAAFEARNPGIKVNFYAIPFVQDIPQLTVRFAGNSPPDVVHLPTRNFAAFASQGWLLPIDDRLATTDVAATWTSLQADMKWDGKTQGLLLMGYGSLLYYNEALLRAAGLSVPTTPDEWLAAIEKTTNRDKGQFGLVAASIESPSLVVEAGTWVMGQGLDWVQNGKYAFRDPKVVAAIEQYRRSMRFAPPGAKSTVARQYFLDGKAAFLRDGPWVWAFVDKAPEPARSNFRVARLPFPHVTGGTSNSLHMAAGLAPAKRELVWKLMALATTPEWQEKYMLLTAAPAPRKGAITPATAARLPHLQLIADAAASAVSVFPTVPALQEGYNEYSTIFGRGMMRLISTQEPTEAVLAGLERELERAVPLR